MLHAVLCVLCECCCVQIAMPRRVRSLSYNHLEGFIACGGDEGVLKAVKLDAKIGCHFHSALMSVVYLLRLMLYCLYLALVKYFICFDSAFLLREETLAMLLILFAFVLMQLVIIFFHIT